MINIHWRTCTNLYQPCVVRYDTVVKLETVDADVDTFLDMLNLLISGRSSFRHTNPSYGREGEKTYIFQYIPVLPSRTLQSLKHVLYMVKIWQYIFGYDLDQGQNPIRRYSQNNAEDYSGYEGHGDKYRDRGCCWVCKRTACWGTWTRDQDCQGTEVLGYFRDETSGNYQ